MKSLKLLGAIVLPVALFAGCKGGGSGAPVTVADFCTQYADAVCQITTTTCVGVSLATCTSYQESVCTTLASHATADGKRIFAPGNVGDCIAKVKGAFASTAPITPATQATIDLACNYVFQGKGVQLTDSCTSQFDCAGTTNGTIICDAAASLCATAMTVAGTKQCSEVGAVCATNFYCATSTANVSLCTAEGTSAAASDCTTAPCDTNSRCANGTCMPLVAAGGACAANSDCATATSYCDRFGDSPACDKGLSFANSSPSCQCVGQGVNCPAGLPATWGVSAGTAAGTSGNGGAGGAAGAPGGAAGHGAAGASGAGTGGVGGGAAGAAGGAGATAGAAGGAGGAAGGAANDNA